MAFERISVDHRRMGGLPCIRGLRIPVSTVLGQLAAGRNAQEILADFPDLAAGLPPREGAAEVQTMLIARQLGMWRGCP